MLIAERFAHLVRASVITKMMRARRETWVCPSTLGIALAIALAKVHGYEQKEIPGVGAPGI